MNSQPETLTLESEPAQQAGQQGRCAVATGSDSGISYEEWDARGGDTDGIQRTVCHSCDAMFPLVDMTEDDRFDNICPHCIADRQNID